MKKINKKPIGLFCILFLIILASSCHVIIETDKLYELVEQAYFEGQRDVLENDIRIKLDQDSCWIWKKSPWDTGKRPIFDPSFNCTETNLK